jgi:hypothetical protein
MDTQRFQNDVPTCPCGARLGGGSPTLCRKCVARVRYNRRLQARGTHGGADRGVRTRRRSCRRDGGDA